MVEKVPMLIVSPLAAVAGIAVRQRHGWACGLLGPEMAHPLLPLAERRRLKLAFHDIAASRCGLRAAAVEDMRAFLAFVARWRDAADGRRAGAPLILHCWMGVSRSPAAAYVAMCLLHGPGHEMALARQLRALAPFATPNARMVALADALLGRGGRMRAAIAAIGRGREAAQGSPFAWPLRRRFTR